jgi:hypothetical protein
MGNILLHHPVVYLYLLSAAVLVAACIWDYRRNPPATPDDSRTRRMRRRTGRPVFSSPPSAKTLLGRCRGGRGGRIGK